jgi:hypothetical protein
MYLDLFRSDWLRYLTDAPSRGRDWLAEVQYGPDKFTQLYLRFRHEAKMKNVTGEEYVSRYLVVKPHESIRLHMQYRITAALSGKTRLETSRYANSRGCLIFQDLAYATPFKGFTLAGRMALFSIDDYNARIYATEQDVLYQYSVPLYQDSGIRYYAVTHIRLSRVLDLWLKYSCTVYSNVQSIGSGTEQISGNTVSDMRVQVRLRL